MPTKHYRLKLDHPYAKKGTILEVEMRDTRTITLDRVGTALGRYVHIPTDVENTWLEEVKEQVTFTKEQKEALQALIYSKRFPHNTDRCGWALSQCVLEDFLDAHATTEE